MYEGLPWFLRQANVANVIKRIANKGEYAIVWIRTVLYRLEFLRREWKGLNIEYSKRASKFIAALDRPTKQRLKEAIEGLTEQPPKGDIKALQGYSDGRKRLRVGKYRIIYNYLDDNSVKILYIMDVDSRGDIYK